MSVLASLRNQDQAEASATVEARHDYDARQKFYRRRRIGKADDGRLHHELFGAYAGSRGRRTLAEIFVKLKNLLMIN